MPSKDEKLRRKEILEKQQKEEMEKLIVLAKKQGFSSVEEYITVSSLDSLIGKNSKYDSNPYLKIMHDSRDLYERARNIAKLGENCVEPLIHSLSMNDPLQRQCACYALGMLGDIRAVEQLCEILKDNSPIVRAEAAAALGKLKSFKAMDALKEATNDNDSYVREKAIESLKLVGFGESLEPFGEKLKDNDSEVRKTAAKSLAKMDDPRIVEFLVPALSDSQYGVAFYAKQGLKKFPNESLDMVIEGLGNKGRYLRQFSIELLGSNKNPKCVPIIINFLKDSKNKEIRKLSAEALGKIKHKDCIPSLISALSDNSDEVLEASIKALNKLKAIDAIPVIIKGLKEKRYNITAETEAIKLLGKIGNDDSIDTLATYIKDENVMFGEEAALAMCKIKNKRTIPILESIAKSKWEKAKIAAEKQIDRLSKLK